MVPTEPAPSLPARYRVAHDHGRLTITRRWLGPGSYIATAAALLWDFYAVQMWSAPNGWVHGDPPILFTLSMAAVGIAVSYIAIAMILNSTHLVVDRSRLTRQSGPLPWAPEPPIEVAELDQLYVKCSRSDLEEGGLMTFSVHAQLRGGEDERLFDDLATTAQAEYLEREIEDLLGIRDRAISMTRR
ncbi:MAG: hypothetical protein AAF721_03595 [Myxococcota bacterium]